MTVYIPFPVSELCLWRFGPDLLEGLVYNACVLGLKNKTFITGVLIDAVSKISKSSVSARFCPSFTDLKSCRFGICQACFLFLSVPDCYPCP